jgi:Cu+-exporting ATPase
MAGTGVAARHGILIKDAEALEVAHAVNIVAFDKTGTLTEGRPSVVALEPAPGLARGEVLRLAGAVQAGSEHPLARAVVAMAGAEGVARAPAEDVAALPGRGVSARVEGLGLRLGSRRLMDELGIDLGNLGDRAKVLQREGRTLSWLAEVEPQRRLLGLVAFADEIKPSAVEAIAALHRVGVRTIMLTGDNPGSAGAVAARLGIDEVVAEILPQDKAAAVAALKRAGDVVAMVGDGVNDAPALAAADVGIAMATGTDVAMHAAGVTLMRGDPALVADAIDVSRRTYAKDSPKSLLGFRVQCGWNSARGVRLAQPGGRRRGHGAVERQRDRQRAAAAPVAAGAARRPAAGPPAGAGGRCVRRRPRPEKPRNPHRKDRP